jgi:antirestriction protein ArdC
LIAEEHPSPFYLTFLQAKEKGIRINTGSSGALILFWKLLESAKDDESLVKKTPFIRHSYVFNLSQTSLNEEVAEHDGIVSAEDLILKMNNLPVIKNNYRRCAYSVTDDFITIPVISDFETKEEYYSAFFMKPYTQLVILSA